MIAVEKETMDGIVNYLAEQKYKDVYKLIAAIQTEAKLVNIPDEKPDIKPDAKQDVDNLPDNPL